VISVDVIIVAAGSGTRLGSDVPKAFVPLAGKPLFIHSLLQFACHRAVNRIIVVAPPSMIQKTRLMCSQFPINKEVDIVAGGEHRWQSVENGLKGSAAEWVMVHDSARPFVSTRTIDAVLSLMEKFDAVISATPEVDTVRKFSGDRALETIDRNELVRVQTPQLFKREKLISAFPMAASLSTPPTDEALLMEKAGFSVGIAWGDPLNFKITTKQDLVLAEAICEKRG
jgi:2-C-methyl-D-erythritol 4-phosphate cytidylyltransferase